MNLPNSSIQVVFDPNTLEALLRDGKLHVSDFNCLNRTSQQGVWAMLRSVAASAIGRS